MKIKIRKIDEDLRYRFVLTVFFLMGLEENELFYLDFSCLSFLKLSLAEENMYTDSK